MNNIQYTQGARDTVTSAAEGRMMNSMMGKKYKKNRMVKEMVKEMVKKNGGKSSRKFDRVKVRSAKIKY